MHTIPFPAVIMKDWVKDYIYFPNLTMDCLEDYAREKSIAVKGCKKGANLHRANHVRNVEFNNIVQSTENKKFNTS